MAHRVRNLGYSASLAHMTPEYFQILIWKYLGLLALTVIPMAVINLIGWHPTIMSFLGGFPLSTINLVFVFAGVYFLTFVGFQPKFLSLSALIGAGANRLADNDMSQGALSGLKTQRAIVLTIVVIYADVAMFMSLVPFKLETAFILAIVLAAMLIVGVASVNMGGSGGLFKWSFRLNILIAILGVLAAFFYYVGTRGDDGNTQAQASVQSATQQVVSVVSRPQAVVLPMCRSDPNDLSGWSKPIDHKRWPGRVDWPPPSQIPTLKRFVDNRTGQLVITDGHGRYYTDAISFCTLDKRFAGHAMPLNW